MEPSRRELKIPLRVLCLLSYKIESRGPSGLRAELTIRNRNLGSTVASQRTPSAVPDAPPPLRREAGGKSRFLEENIGCFLAWGEFLMYN